MGKVFAILGRSATGKSTVESHLEAMRHHRIISNTTRNVREGEVKDKDYHYLSNEEFEKLKQNNQLVENSQYNNWSYGICYNDIKNLNKQNYICVIEVTGFKQLQINLGKDKVIPILLYTEPYTRLKRALEREPHASDNTYKEIARRFLSDFDLFNEFEKNCIYKINNIDSYESAKIIDRIIKTESNYKLED